MSDRKPITATLTKPYIFLEGTIGSTTLNMPMSVEEAAQLRDALDRALAGKDPARTSGCQDCGGWGVHDYEAGHTPDVLTICAKCARTRIHKGQILWSVGKKPADIADYARRQQDLDKRQR